jgi:peptidoglycan/LPS O-acetylase OafA/YrhL
MIQNKFLHIESLRAIAVIFVLVYHSGFEILRGGFVGVDMFLVISGFLMSYTAYDRGDKFDLLKFYSKRLMRLYPHLAVMLLSVSFLTYLILPPYLLAQSAQSAAAAILSVSNLYFLLQADYFGSESLVSPFIHTWSLGLEVQFYIIFGLIVAFTSKRNAVMSLLLITVCSFILNAKVINHNQPVAYFLLPSRFWEFGVGSLLYFLPGAKGFVPSLALKCLTFLSFLLLFASAYYYHSGLAFPGYYALVPVIATSVLIVGTPKVPLINNLLKLNWLVFLGGISYGLYLWHQPLLALIRIYFSNEPSVYALISVFVLSILLSAIIKISIEEKSTGYSFFEPKVLMAMSLSFMLIISFGYVSTATSGFKGRINDFSSSSSYFYDVDFEKSSGVEILRSTKYNVDYNVPFTVGSSDKKLLFIGDSMAHDISASLAHFDNNTSIFDVRLFRIESNCFYFNIYMDSCQSMLNRSFDVIEKIAPDYIVVSALWKQGADFVKLSEYFKRLKTSQTNPIILLGSTGFNDIYSLAYEVSSFTDEVDDDDVAALTYKHRRGKFEYGNQRIMEISQSLGVIFWDRKKTFCNDLLMQCHILRSNQRPYIWDNAHLTSLGMEKTFHYFNENFNEIFGLSVQ